MRWLQLLLGLLPGLVAWFRRSPKTEVSDGISSPPDFSRPKVIRRRTKKSRTVGKAL